MIILVFLTMAAWNGFAILGAIALMLSGTDMVVAGAKGLFVTWVITTVVNFTGVMVIDYLTQGGW